MLELQCWQTLKYQVYAQLQTFP